LELKSDRGFERGKIGHPQRKGERKVEVRRIKIQ